MNNETYDQISIAEELVDSPQFLMENMEVDILYNAGNDSILTLEMPSTVNLLVTYTEPGLKGDTATNTLKSATTETGAVVMVPLFVNIGEKIKVDTKTGSYVERVK
jgi:elongation factor P